MTNLKPFHSPPARIGAIAARLAVLLAAICVHPAMAQQPPAPAPAAGPVGLWIDHTGRGAVEIAPCGPKLCGRIVWLKQVNDKRGRPLRDGLNADPALRTRAICGLPILGGLVRQRDGSWDNGWIYDPEQGQTFDVELRLRGPDMLQVKGYKAFKFLSETFQWQRAIEPPKPLCPAI